MEMINSEIDLNAQHPSVTERYYTPKYKIDVIKPGEDHRILLHSNRVCVVTLAESHPILKLKKTVEKVDFQVDQHTNRLENKVSGKGKKGGQWLQENSPLCKIHCSDESVYTVRSCLTASLLEANERLVDTPTLLTERPDSTGYIALVLTALKDHERHLGKLLSKEQYLEAISKRTESNQTSEVEPSG